MCRTQSELLSTGSYILGVRFQGRKDWTHRVDESLEGFHLCLQLRHGSDCVCDLMGQFLSLLRLHVWVEKVRISLGVGEEEGSSASDVASVFGEVWENDSGLWGTKGKWGKLKVWQNQKA